MKVAVFENVLTDIKEGFDLINDYYFDNTLEINYFTSSQELGSIVNITTYDIAFIDIALSSNSDLDGVFLIKEILSLNDVIVPELIIITGQTKIQSVLEEHNIDFIPVLQKPFISEEVKSQIQLAILTIETKKPR